MQSSACTSSSCRSFSLLLLGLPQADYFLNRAIRVLRRSSSSNRFPSCQTCVSCGILPIPPPPLPIGGGSLIRNIDSVGDMMLTSSSSSTLLIRTEKEQHHLFRFKQYHRRRRRRTDDRRLLVSAGGSSSGVSSVKGEEEFQAEVLEEEEVAVLVEFVADWCGPCRLMSSIIHWASQVRNSILEQVMHNMDDPSVC